VVFDLFSTFFISFTYFPFPNIRPLGMIFFISYINCFQLKFFIKIIFSIDSPIEPIIKPSVVLSNQATHNLKMIHIIKKTLNLHFEFCFCKSPNVQLARYT
jgi:hypothetical protein